MNNKAAFRAQFFATLVVALITLVGGFVLAQVPSARAAMLNAIGTDFVPPFTLNYQGFLRLPSGEPMTGTHTITARIYDQATDGFLIHEETFDTVVVRDGMFNIVLGDAVPLGNKFNQSNRFISISVDSADELLPRERLHSVPWAFAAYESHRANVANEATTAVNAGHADSADSAGQLSSLSRTSYVHNNTNFIPVTVADFLPPANKPLGACFLTEVKIQKLWASDTWIATEAAGCSIVNDDLTVGPNTQCRVTCLDFGN